MRWKAGRYLICTFLATAMLLSLSSEVGAYTVLFGRYDVAVWECDVGDRHNSGGTIYGTDYGGCNYNYYDVCQSRFGRIWHTYGEKGVNSGPYLSHGPYVNYATLRGS